MHGEEDMSIGIAFLLFGTVKCVSVKFDIVYLYNIYPMNFS
jgi:hypothetical protein